MSDSGYSDGPWSTGFDWGTVEADPDLSAALQERTDQRDSARTWAAALENRLEAVRQHCLAQMKYHYISACSCGWCELVRLVTAPLEGAE